MLGCVIATYLSAFRWNVCPGTFDNSMVSESSTSAARQRLDPLKLFALLTSPCGTFCILPHFQRACIDADTTIEKVGARAAFGDPDAVVRKHLEVRHGLCGFDSNAIVYVPAMHDAYEALRMLTIDCDQEEVIQQT